jgi:hypothetical protein
MTKGATATPATNNGHAAKPVLTPQERAQQYEQERLALLAAYRTIPPAVIADLAKYAGKAPEASVRVGRQDVVLRMLRYQQRPT